MPACASIMIECDFLTFPINGNYEPFSTSSSWLVHPNHWKISQMGSGPIQCPVLCCLVPASDDVRRIALSIIPFYYSLALFNGWIIFILIGSSFCLLFISGPKTAEVIDDEDDEGNHRGPNTNEYFNGNEDNDAGDNEDEEGNNNNNTNGNIPFSVEY